MFNRPLQNTGAHGTEMSRSFADAEFICREGEASTEMFVIQSGSVRIFKAVQPSAVKAARSLLSGPPSAIIELAVLHKGDFFGEMSLLEGLPRDASAQAVGGAEVLVMTPGALLVRLRRDPTFAFELLRRLSGRVRSLNARLVAALAERGAEARTGPAEALLYSSEAHASEAGTSRRRSSGHSGNGVR